MLSGIRIERNMLIRRTNKTEEDKNDLEIDELQIKALETAISAVEGKAKIDEMTNGEVFLSIFPCDEVHINGLQEGCVHFSMKSNPDSMDCFSLDWWNSPYQRGGEE
jgi:hypothetical protein